MFLPSVFCAADGKIFSSAIVVVSKIFYHQPQQEEVHAWLMLETGFKENKLSWR